MLPLESTRWSELRDAYGSASKIPALLGQLAQFPDETSYQAEPWFTLWSSLYHQGDIYSASFAALPHIVEALASDPARASLSYFLLPASIEVARASCGIEVPPDLEQSYHAALSRVPQLAASAAKPAWDSDRCIAALAAKSAATGNHQVAQLLFETELEALPRFPNGCSHADP